MKREITENPAEFCLRRRVLPRKIVEQFETAISSLLRQIRCMADIRITGDQDGRQRAQTIIENGARLLEIPQREPHLMNHPRRYDVRVIQPKGLCRQSIMHSE